MINRDPFNVTLELKKLTAKLPELTNLSLASINKIVKCIIVIDLISKHTESKYYKGIVYDLLSCLLTLSQNKKRYFYLHLRSSIEQLICIDTSSDSTHNSYAELKELKAKEYWNTVYLSYKESCFHIHPSHLKLNISSFFEELKHEKLNDKVIMILIRELNNCSTSMLAILCKKNKDLILDVFCRNRQNLKKLIGQSLYRTINSH